MQQTDKGGRYWLNRIFFCSYWKLQCHLSAPKIWLLLQAVSHRCFFSVYLPLCSPPSLAFSATSACFSPLLLFFTLGFFIKFGIFHFTFCWSAFVGVCHVRIGFDYVWGYCVVPVLSTLMDSFLSFRLSLVCYVILKSLLVCLTVSTSL